MSSKRRARAGRLIAAALFPCQAHAGDGNISVRVDTFLSVINVDLHAIMSGLGELIPVVLGVGRWLYEWQTLFAGILALIAAHIWGRSVIRASEMRAGVPNRIKRSVRAQRSPPQPKATAKDLRVPEMQGWSPDIAEALVRLRATIRGVLARVPAVDETLTASQLAQCKNIGNFVLKDERLELEADMRAGIDTLRRQLMSLHNLSERATGKMAWQVLIAINNQVRNMELQVRTNSPKTSVIV